MSFKFIDTHCHVHFEAYKDDVDEVVQRSLDAGVAMVTIGTQSTTSKNGIALAEKYDGVWATIGLHPNHLHAQEFFDTNELPAPNGKVEHPTRVKTRAEAFDSSYYEELVKHPKVVAIGEFGLDYYRIPEGTNREQVIADQKAECKKQLSFASQFQKPIVIHCRDAHADQIALIDQQIEQGGLQKRGVIHSFTGNAIEAALYKERGFLLGINGIITFSKELQNELQSIPLEQLVIETDAPYLTPPPHRGKRNEPAYVEFIAKKIAEIKNCSVEEVAMITNENARRIFNLF